MQVRERFEDASLLDVDLRTGRTHQIRVHLAFIKHPILGDAVYGTARSRERAAVMGIRRQMLHSAELRIALPSGGEPRTFSAPLPRDMSRMIDALREVRDG